MDDATKRKAYAMRLSGMSWAAIANELHYNRSHLYREMTVVPRPKQSRKRRHGK